MKKFVTRPAFALVAIFGTVALMLGLGLTNQNNIVYAQLSCEEPFEEGETIRFPTRGWTTDFCVHSVPYEEIRSGGVPRDGIPPIDNPEFDAVAVANEWLEPQSPVIIVEVNDDARAYPLAILTRHEIVNDEIGGEAVAVTYCPLCNSAVAFNREVNGEVLRFGVSGNLRNSDLIMWDDVTESWWQQLTGEAIVGELTGTLLEIIPSQVFGFGEFAARHPEGVVLSPQGRNYGDNPYVGYDENDGRPFLFEGELDDRLDSPVDRVLAVEINEVAIAYPFDALEAERVINDTVGGDAIVAFWQPGKASAMGARVIDEARDVGMAALYSRMLEDGTTLTFAWDADAETVTDTETGSVWNVFGEAVEGELTGAQLRQVIAAPHFWFAWAAFHPETFVYGLDDENVE